jgi:transposase
MPKPLPIPEGTVEKLRLELKKARTKEHYRRLLCVWMRVALGMHSREIGRILDWGPEMVRYVQRTYFRGGEAALRDSARGGRRHQNMTKQAEHEFLARLLEETRPNAILNVRYIQLAYEKRVGHAVSDSVIYRLLKRHDWRRLACGHVLVPRWAPARLPPGSEPANDWQNAWPQADL